MTKEELNNVRQLAKSDFNNQKLAAFLLLSNGWNIDDITWFFIDNAVLKLYNGTTYNIPDFIILSTYESNFYDVFSEESLILSLDDNSLYKTIFSFSLNVDSNPNNECQLRLFNLIKDLVKEILYGNIKTID